MSKERDFELAQQYFKEAGQCFYKEEYQKAIHLAEKTKALYEKWENWKLVVNCLNSIGNCCRMLSEYHRALKCSEQGLEIVRKHIDDDYFSKAHCLELIGNYHGIFGNYNRSIQYYEQSLEVLKPIEHEKADVKIGDVYHGIGHGYGRKRDYTLSNYYYEQALEYKKKYLAEDDYRVGITLNNLGINYNFLKKYDLAIQHHKQALAIRQKHYGDDHYMVARSLGNLGSAYQGKGNYPSALQCHQQCLTMFQKRYGAEHPILTLAFLNLGETYGFCGEYDKSIKLLQKAVSLSRNKVDFQASNWILALLGLGTAYQRTGEFQLALDCFQEILVGLIPDYHEISPYCNPSVSNYKEGILLLNVFVSKNTAFLQKYHREPQNIKDLQAALSAACNMTDLLNDIRQNYKTESSKHTLANLTIEPYNQAIDTVLKVVKIYQSQAVIPIHPEITNIPYTLQAAKSLMFDFTEQRKAIVLLSSLKETEAKTTANIPALLLAKEEELLAELNELDTRIAVREAKPDLKGTESDELITQLKHQHFTTKRTYDQLIEQFEKDYPKYHQLKHSVSTATIQDLQKYLQSSHVAVQQFNNETIQPFNNSTTLSYHLSTEKIYLFAITSNDYQIAAIEKPDNFSEIVEKLQSAIQLGHIEHFIESATQLFDLLLKPIWETIGKTSNLIIIPHNELYYVPFDVLLNQAQITDSENFENLPYLIRDYNISYHYSATMLLHSHDRQEETSKQIDSFFGLAPIHFGGENAPASKEGYIVKSGGGQLDKKRRVVLKSSGDEEEALQDLEDTEAEVKEIYQLFEEQNKEAIALFYDQANKENLQEHIGGYKYVLISTHGFLQETGKKTLSGIHLAQKRQTELRRRVNGKRQTELRRRVNDGRQMELEGMKPQIMKNGKSIHYSDNYILHTSETYHLNLNADLVVLSSCESGIGELKAGEGMMALNRGFLYAGAANIVYSLFKVPQDSTSQLTQSLFRYILEEEMSYAEALRKAKLELIADEMMEPLDWAGFALIGR